MFGTGVTSTIEKSKRVSPNEVCRGAADSSACLHIVAVVSANLGGTGNSALAGSSGAEFLRMTA